MNLPATQKFAFDYVKKNEFVIEKKTWGAKSTGIQPGDRRHGVILGFTEFNGKKELVIRCFEEDGAVVIIYGCKSLSKQLHVEQDYPFINLVYQVGDPIVVIFEGSFIANKGQAAGKLIANYTVRGLGGYNLTPEDVQAIQNFQAEQMRTKPLAAYPVVNQQPQQQQFQQQNFMTQPTPINYAQNFQPIPTPVNQNYAQPTPMTMPSPINYAQNFQPQPTITQQAQQFQPRQGFQKPAATDSDFEI